MIAQATRTLDVTLFHLAQALAWNRQLRRIQSTAWLMVVAAVLCTLQHHWERWTIVSSYVALGTYGIVTAISCSLKFWKLYRARKQHTAQA